jgi:hypothetical protein
MGLGEVDRASNQESEAYAQSRNRAKLKRSFARSTAADERVR